MFVFSRDGSYVECRALTRGRFGQSGRLKVSDFAHSLDQSKVDFAQNLSQSEVDFADNFVLASDTVKMITVTHTCRIDVSLYSYRYTQLRNQLFDN